MFSVSCLLKVYGLVRELFLTASFSPHESLQDRGVCTFRIINRHTGFSFLIKRGKKYESGEGTTLQLL